MNEKLKQAVALHQQGQFDAAKQLYQEILRHQPKHFDALHLLGVIAAQTQDFSRAIELISEAVKIQPNNASAHNNLGGAQKALHQLPQALASFDLAIKYAPNTHDAYKSRGEVLHQMQRFDEAIASYERALGINPKHADIYSNLGSVLQDMMRTQEALDCYRLAIAINPNHLEAHSNSGMSYLALTEVEQALTYFDKAIQIAPHLPDIYFYKSLALLLSGHLAQGLNLYEARWHMGELKGKQSAFQVPQWVGQPIKNKTIFLYNEQGHGDLIQFARYIKQLHHLGARVLLQVPASFLNLFSSLEGVDELLIEGATVPRFDFHCPVMSLAFAFKTELHTIPSTAFYLKSDPAKREYWRNKVGTQTKPRIGIVWSGRAAHKNDHNRSLTLATLNSMMQASPRYDFISLQKEMRQIDQATSTENPHIRQLELQDYADTAALIELMDLVISVDTSVAHLSGALGKKTLLLLPFSPDWRWLLGREDSPWYPSITLIRQSETGDWDGVMARVNVMLNSMLAAPPAHSTDDQISTERQFMNDQLH